MSHPLIKTTNAGRTWTTLSTLGQATLVAASGSQARPIPLPRGMSGVAAAAFTSHSRGWLLAGSTFGAPSLYQTDNAGTTWISRPVPVAYAHMLALRGSDIAVLGGDVAVSTDGGRHWSQHTFGGSSIILDSAAWNNGTLWVFGTRGPTSTPVTWTWSQGEWIRHSVDAGLQSVSLTGAQG